ncbi:MAG: nucleoid-associated protein [Gammaproteobacteria bacterium]|nr:nucleoid-associated protein [Gammaproteobacteria bacterium]
MTIEHVILHHLKSDDNDVVLFTRDAELSENEQIKNLLDDLKRGYRSRLNRRHGYFAESASLLSQSLDAVLAGKQSFLECSKTIMQQFEKTAKEEKIALDTHFLFVEEKLEQQHLFYLFGISQNELMRFNEMLEINVTSVLDTGVSLFGIKVDIDEWQQRPKSAYISAIPPRGNTALTSAFFTITGFESGLNKEEATMSFLEGVESFAQNVPEEKVQAYREQVVDYCVKQDQKDEPVNITELSKNLEGIDCEKFVKAMLPHNPVNAEGEEEKLMVDRASLKRYTRFFGREKDLSISFSSAQLNDRVHYNAETDTLTITGLPKALKKQLLKYIER